MTPAWPTKVISCVWGCIGSAPRAFQFTCRWRVISIPGGWVPRFTPGGVAPDLLLRQRVPAAWPRWCSASFALEELGNKAADNAAVIMITVLTSVVVHGATADPLAARYARHLARQAGRRAGAGMPGIPARRLIRRTSRINHPREGEQSLAR